MKPIDAERSWLNSTPRPNGTNLIDRLGVVLAGGKSSRFGSDKFVHVLDGVEMGLRAIRTLQPIVDRVVVAGRFELPPEWGAGALFGPREGSGPLGAIMDASEATEAQLIVVIPCDMPRLTSTSIAKLSESMESSNADAAFAHSAHFEEAQWLTACWRGDGLRNRVGPLYEAGIRSVREVARHIPHVLVDLPPDELVNVNEPVSA
jgi:molybdopterin-guanine dinucleotide biosynthesis protein A